MRNGNFLASSKKSNKVFRSVLHIHGLFFGSSLLPVLENGVASQTY
jgi:hypothetical protein